VLRKVGVIVLCAKIIDSRRYKTITKTQLEKKKKNNEKILKSEKSNYRKTNKYSTNNDNNSIISNLMIRKHREKKKEQEVLLYSRPQRTVIKETKPKVYIPKSFIISCCAIVSIVLIYTSAKIMKIDEKITTTVFNDNEKENSSNVNLEPNYDLKIGLSLLDNTDVYKSTNLILNDLYKNLSFSFVKIENNYDIVYKVAKKIEKISDTEYKISLNDEYKLDINDIRYSIEKILSYGENTMYYDRISNIYSVEDTKVKGEIVLKLKEANPYFVYYLDFPILDDNDKIDFYYMHIFSELFIYATFVLPKNLSNQPSCHRRMTASIFDPVQRNMG